MLFLHQYDRVKEQTRLHEAFDIHLASGALDDFVRRTSSSKVGKYHKLTVRAKTGLHILLNCLLFVVPMIFRMISLRLFLMMIFCVVSLQIWITIS